MKIVFATNNQHKLQEIRDILGSDYEVVSLKEIGCNVDIPKQEIRWRRMPCRRRSMFTTIITPSCFADDTVWKWRRWMVRRVFTAPAMLKVPTTTARQTWQNCSENWMERRTERPDSVP